MSRSGVEKAAILLLTLGEQDAAQVLKHLGAKDVQRVGSAMAQLSGISREEVATVLSTFSSELEQQTSVGIDTDAYVRKVLMEALGSDKANSIIDRILRGRNGRGLESLKWMEPRAIADMMRTEHPQITAIVLSYLDSDQAQAPFERGALETQAGRAANHGRIAGMKAQRLLARRTLEVVVAQFDADGLAYVAMALEILRQALAQLRKQCAQLAAIAHGVQIALEGGFAAHRYRLARRDDRPIVAAPGRLIHPRAMVGSEVLCQEGALAARQFTDRADPELFEM